MNEGKQNPHTFILAGQSEASRTMCVHEWKEIEPPSPNTRVWACKCGARNGLTISAAQIGTHAAA